MGTDRTNVLEYDQIGQPMNLVEMQDGRARKKKNGMVELIDDGQDDLVSEHSAHP